MLPDEFTPLPETDMQRLLRLARTSRVIEDQIFVLDGPVKLSGINDLTITRCQFLLPKPTPSVPYMFDVGDCQYLRVFECHFKFPVSLLPDSYAEYRWRMQQANARLLGR